MGILYGLLVGVTIAGYTLWDANAVVQQKLPPLGYFWVTVLVQLVAFAPFALRQPRFTVRLARQHWWAVLVVGILSPLAYVLILSRSPWRRSRWSPRRARRASCWSRSAAGCCFANRIRCSESSALRSCSGESRCLRLANN